MRVLQVSTPVTWRGGEQQLAWLTDGLKVRGEIKQWVLTPEGSELSRRLSQSGPELLFFRKPGLIQFSLARIIAGSCQTHSIDIVHAHDSHAHTAVVVATAFFGLRLPIVVSRRVDFPVSKSLWSTWKYNHHSIRRILCVSEEVRRVTAPALKDQSVLRVVYDGIDTSRYERRIDTRSQLLDECGFPPESRLVGNLSALADHKDYPTWLRAAAVILKEEPDVRFIIAGQGPEKESILALINELNLESHVKLLGFRTDVCPVMFALDVFMFSSKTEGLGTITLEALAAGVPVAATRAGGVPEVIADGECGLLAPVGDHVALAQCVVRLLRDSGLRARLSEAGIRRSGQFSYREMADQTYRIYRDIVTN